MKWEASKWVLRCDDRGEEAREKTVQAAITENPA
jgi:hypothetical protein